QCRRPDRDRAARHRRQTARHPGPRPHHHRSRTVPQLRGDRTVVTSTALRETIPGWSLDEGANARLDQELLARAYRFSEEAHRGQTRNSGDPYITHCVEVAKILGDLQLDTSTVVCGLIHDV